EQTWPLSLDQSFTVTVNGVNDRPTVDRTNDGLQDVVVNEDSSDTVIDLWDYFDDVEDGDALTYEVVGTPDPNLFESVTIGADGHTLTIDYKENGNGSDEITIRGTDNGDGYVDGNSPEQTWPLSLDQSFTVTVNPENDQPTVDQANGGLENVEVNEDAADTVIDLRDHFDDVEDGGDLNYEIVGTPDTNLFDSVSIGADGHTLTIDYKVNAYGSDSITIRGTDNGDGTDTTQLSSDQTFTVDVASCQDAPTIDFTGLPGMRTNEETPLLFEGLSIDDADFPNDPDVELVASIWVDNGTLSIADAGASTRGGGDGSNQANAVTLTGSPDEINAALALGDNLTYDPDAQFWGKDTLHVSVNDQGYSGDPAGALTETDNTQIQVDAQKDATVIQVPGTQIVGNYSHLKFGHGKLFRVTDNDAFADSTGKGVTVTLSAKFGDLTLGSTKGISWVKGNGNRVLTFKATSQSAVNCALYKLDYYCHNYNCTDRTDLIKIKVHDLANDEWAIKGVHVNIKRPGSVGGKPRR
ncbi:hypothetical protein ACFL2Q_18820, partial [Thermodesulfobacteriota bacterium]